MARYRIRAKIDQIVTKEIVLLVGAASEEEATAKATSALNEYPEPVTEPSIHRMVATNSHYWIPKSVEFVEIEEEEDG